MVIESLDLENYGIIKKANLVFNKKGFNVFSGSTGQGKSHAIRSLNYLLFNHTYGKIEDDCNWESNYFSAGTKLSHNSNSFEIKTVYDRDNGVSKELTIDNKRITGNNEVKDTLFKYFDPSITKASMVSLQGNMDIVEAGDAERREYLKKIYDLTFKQQIETVKEDIGSLDDKIVNLEKDIYLYEHKEYTPTPLIPIEITEEENTKNQYELELLRVKKQHAEDVLFKISDFIKRIEKLTEDKDKIVLKKDTVDNKMITLNKELLDLQKESTTFKKSYIDKETELQKQLDEIVLKRIQTFNEVDLTTAQTNYENAIVSLSTTEKDFKLSSLDLCPTCKKPFESAEKETFKTLYEESKTNKEICSKNLTELKAKKIQITDITTIQTSLKEKKISLAKDIEYNRESANIAETNNDERIKSKTIDLSERTIESIQLEKDLVLIISDITKLQYDKSLLIEDSLTVSHYEQEMEKIQKSITDYDSIVVKNTFIVKSNITLEKDKIKDKIILDKHITDKNKVLKQKDELKQIVDILKVDFPKFVINSMVGDIEGGMNKLLDLAYAGRYNCNIKESKKGLKILYGDKQKDIKLSSGGEQNLFNLGFKNALTQISKLKILILDEADNFLSSDIAKKAFGSLNKLIESGDVNQIFVITHKEDLRDLLISDFGAKAFYFEEGLVT